MKNNVQDTQFNFILINVFVKKVNAAPTKKLIINNLNLLTLCPDDARMF